MRNTFFSALRTTLFLFHFFAMMSKADCQTPSAVELFEQMKGKIASIKTISYSLVWKNVDSGQNDSVSIATSETWVQREPKDTIFGSHFHTKQKNKNGHAEYYYDGHTGIDIYHFHKRSSEQKTVTVVTPFLLANGSNSVQARITARGYCTELLSTTMKPNWHNYLDSMLVNDSGEAWLIEWRETIPADHYTALHRVYLDKETNLICRIHQQSIWQGVRGESDLRLSNLRINHNGDIDSVSLKTSYPDYEVRYVNKKNYNRSDISISLVGTQAKDFSFPGLEGGMISLKPRQNRLLLIDFWETWCGYCFVAMPKIKSLYEKYNDKGLDIVAVVTENEAQVRQILKAHPFPYPTVLADARLKEAYQLVSRPRYLLIDFSGAIILDTVGELAQVEKEINARLTGGH